MMTGCLEYTYIPEVLHWSENINQPDQTVHSTKLVQQLGKANYQKNPSDMRHDQLQLLNALIFQLQPWLLP